MLAVHDALQLLRGQSASVTPQAVREVAQSIRRYRQAVSSEGASTASDEAPPCDAWQFGKLLMSSLQTVALFCDRDDEDASNDSSGDEDDSSAEDDADALDEDLLMPLTQEVEWLLERLSCSTLPFQLATTSDIPTSSSHNVDDVGAAKTLSAKEAALLLSSGIESLSSSTSSTDGTVGHCVASVASAFVRIVAHWLRADATAHLLGPALLSSLVAVCFQSLSMHFKGSWRRLRRGDESDNDSDSDTDSTSSDDDGGLDDDARAQKLRAHELRQQRAIEAALSQPPIWPEHVSSDRHLREAIQAFVAVADAIATFPRAAELPPRNGQSSPLRLTTACLLDVFTFCLTYYEAKARRNRGIGSRTSVLLALHKVCNRSREAFDVVTLRALVFPDAVAAGDARARDHLVVPRQQTRWERENCSFLDRSRCR